jgi:hypothetical protein
MSDILDKKLKYEAGHGFKILACFKLVQQMQKCTAIKLGNA